VSPPSDTPRFGWTDSQRRVLLVLLCVFLVFLAARYACNRMYVGDPQPETPPRYDQLADRIDPNTADWQTLAALPGIGEAKARDIVAYRERKRAEAKDPSLVVFDAPGDLLYVRGIGAALVEAMKPHLLFPPATRRPATTVAL
jgi:DNA uptake protein ComE-like DNA-binding protein